MSNHSGSGLLMKKWNCFANMPPYGHPNYDFPDYQDKYEDKEEMGVGQVTLWYCMVLVTMLLIWISIFLCLRILTLSMYLFYAWPHIVFIGIFSVACIHNIIFGNVICEVTVLLVTTHAYLVDLSNGIIHLSKDTE